MFTIKKICLPAEVPLWGTKVGIIELVLILIVSFCLGAKSCVNRNLNKTKSGSSIDGFMINAPLGLIAAAISSSQINLSWQDNSNNEDGFEIWRSVDGSNFSLLASVDSFTTSYSDAGLAPSTIYYYQVRAMNTIGDRSDYSNEASATTFRVVWSALAAGESHSIALTTSGTILGWGNNYSGQLGLGDFSPAIVTLPTLLGTDTDWSRIGAGYNHTLSIKINLPDGQAGGTLWAWGANESGQLGLGNNDFDGYEPTQVGIDSDWSRIAAGANHTIGIKTNNTLWSWGWNLYGQLGLGDSGNGTDRYTPTQIGTLSDWSLVAGGSGSHTIALKTNKTLWAWGWNEAYQLGLNDQNTRTIPTKVGVSSDWSIVTANYNQSFALKTNKTIWMWGLEYLTNPIQLGTDRDWSMIEAGGVATWQGYLLALKSNPSGGGTLWAMGYNGFGQLGLSDLNYREVLTRVSPDVYREDWVSIEAGGAHSMGTSADGTLRVWGANYDGQLGLGDTINRNMPTPPGSLVPPSSLVATVTPSPTIALSWIDNSVNETGFKIERKFAQSGIYGQIITVGSNIVSWSDTGPFSSGTYYYRIKSYNNSGESSYSNEVSQSIYSHWSMFTSGIFHTLSLKTNPDGSVRTLWGYGTNGYFQLGLSDSKTRTTPSQMGTSSDWSVLAAGFLHSLGVKTTGTLWAWGANTSGQLGLGNIVEYSIIPNKIGTASDWSRIAAGYSHSLGLKTTGTLWAWGGGDSYNFGQLGLGDYTDRTTPTLVTTGIDWSMITAGTYHTIALKTNRTLWTWGRNNEGQLGDGTTLNRNTPCQIGTQGDWSMIAAGYTYTISLKTNNTLWAWGVNTSGQLGFGDTINRNVPDKIGTASDWSMIAAGGVHALSLKTNRTLWAWGWNDYGQLGLGDAEIRTSPVQVGTDSDWSMIGANWLHSIGIKLNQTLWVWGLNGNGQLGLGDRVDRNVPTLIGE